MAELASTVWMIHSGTSLEGVKGQLSMEPEGVVFRPRGGGAGGDRVFVLEHVRRVKRVLGSPVLEFHMRGGGGPPVVGFYFVQPPSLAAQDDSHVIERRRLRRHAAVALVKWNAVKKAEVATWVEAVRQAKKERGR